MITTSAQLLGVQPTSLQHGTQGLRRRKTLRRFKKELAAATISIVPNPAVAWMSITFDTKDTDSAGAIEVRDMMGKVVHRATVAGSKGQIIWDCRGVPAGTYATALLSSSGSQLVVQRAIVQP